MEPILTPRMPADTMESLACMEDGIDAISEAHGALLVIGGAR
jgi:hypothetical protein